MRVAFDFVCDEAPLFARMGELLRDEGWQICGLTLGQRWSEYWRTYETGALCRAAESDAELRQQLERIEREYGEFWPAAQPQADRFIVRMSRERQVELLVATFLGVEDFLDREQPDLYCCTGIAYLYHLVSYAVCRKRGIPHVAFYPDRGETPRWTIALATNDQRDLVNEQFAKLLELPLEERREIVARQRAEFAERQRKIALPWYMTLKNQSFKLEPVFVREFLVRLRHYYLQGWGRAGDDFLTAHPLWLAWRDLKKICRAAIYSRFHDRIYDDPDLGERFYLFPLHHQPEASTLIHAHWFENQLESVRQVAKCIPADALLYVKEHPTAYGRHSLRFYRQIRRLHNVRLISPHVALPGLLESCQATITLTSAVGWEALLTGKRCFVLGNTFWDRTGAAVKLESFAQLRRAVREYGTGIPDELREQALLFREALARGTFPGWFGVAKLDFKMPVLSPDNVRQLAAVLAEQVAPAVLPQRA